MANLKMLAVDLGASSGRGIIGEFNGKKLSLREIHRFKNEPVMVNGTFMWDILRIFHEIKSAVRIGSSEGNLSTMGIDTWGVDFGLLDKTGNLMENPIHYRDARTDNINIEAYKRIPREKLYKIAGIQYLQFNTIFQLLSLSMNRPHMLENTETMLLIPDLLNYFLSGIKKSEYTIASTTSMLDAKNRNWSTELLGPMNIPSRILTEIVKPSTILGTLSAQVAGEVNASGLKIVNVGSHDTASAIASVPSAGDDFVYISSGTWSLMGIESAEPVINELSTKFDFTNEGGLNGTIRVLRNVMGLWLEQESIRQWEREGEKISFDELSALARAAKPFECLINPDDPAFLAPGNMPERIRQFCKDTGQTVPLGKGEIIRCIFDSLALTYRQTVERINLMTNKKTKSINIIGGGSKEEMLCQFTASACGIPVVAGPVEATSIGNLTSQLIAAGEIKTLKEARQIISESFDVKTYKPTDIAAWDDAYGKYIKLIEK